MTPIRVSVCRTRYNKTKPKRSTTRRLATNAYNNNHIKYIVVHLCYLVNNGNKNNSYLFDHCLSFVFLFFRKSHFELFLVLVKE